MYRISRKGQEPTVDVDTLDEIYPTIQRSEPGRYHIDVMSANPLPLGCMSKR
jgi:hypothetical protein